MRQKFLHVALVALSLLATAFGASAALAQQPTPARPPEPFEAGPAEEIAVPTSALVPEPGQAPAGYPFNGQWHAGYYQPWYGRPVALVVPPVAHYQTIWGWGVGATQLAPIPPQFNGASTGYPYTQAGPWAPKPYWPTDTRQFGVYYIRGPW